MSVYAVSGDPVVAQHAFPNGPDAFYRTPRPCVAVVGFQANSQRAQALEGVTQQQKFTFCVDGSALVFGAVPGHADFQGPVRPVDIEEPRGSDGATFSLVYNGELDTFLVIVPRRA
jgi:hypothetical protein